MLGPSSNHGHVVSSLRRSSSSSSFRSFILLLLIVPIFLYLSHTLFLRSSSFHRSACDTELDALHLSYKDRLVRILNDLRLQTEKETLALKSVAHASSEIRTLMVMKDELVKDGREWEVEKKRLIEQVKELQERINSMSASSSSSSSSVSPSPSSPADSTDSPSKDSSASPAATPTPAAAATVTVDANSPGDSNPTSPTHISSPGPVAISGRIEVRPYTSMREAEAHDHDATNAAPAAATVTPKPTNEPGSPSLSIPVVSKSSVDSLDGSTPSNPLGAIGGGPSPDKEFETLQAIAKVLTSSNPTGMGEETSKKVNANEQNTPEYGPVRNAPIVPSLMGGENGKSIPPISDSILPGDTLSSHNAVDGVAPILSPLFVDDSTATGSGHVAALPIPPSPPLPPSTLPAPRPDPSSLGAAQAADPELRQAEEAIQRLERQELLLEQKESREPGETVDVPIELSSIDTINTILPPTPSTPIVSASLPVGVVDRLDSSVPSPSTLPLPTPPSVDAEGVPVTVKRRRRRRTRQTIQDANTQTTTTTVTTPNTTPDNRPPSTPVNAPDSSPRPTTPNTQGEHR